MFDLNSIISTSSLSAPPKIIIYGPPGVGKTTMATAFPTPYLIRTEECGNSLRGRDIATKAGGPCREIGEVYDQLESIASVDHPFKTLVIDSLDWLGSLIEKNTCEKLRTNTIADLEFGRGFSHYYADVKNFFEYIDFLREKRGMIVVLTAHAAPIETRDPDCEKFTTFSLKLPKGAAAIATEWADEVWYLTTDVKAASSKNDKTKIGRGTGGRVVHVSMAPGYVAKTRQLLRAEYAVGQDRNFSALLQAFFEGEQLD